MTVAATGRTPKNPALMECGHVAQGVISSSGGDPEGFFTGGAVCVICDGIDPGARVVAIRPSLDGRMARCLCGTVRPSAFGLAFFELRDRPTLLGWCEMCDHSIRVHRTAAKRVHPNDALGADVRLRGDAFGPVCQPGLHVGGTFPCPCEGFVPKAVTHEFDAFYCGCQGWD